MDLRLVPAALGAWAVAAWGTGADQRHVVAVAVVAVLVAGGSLARWRALGVLAVAVAAVAASVAWRLGDVGASPLVGLADDGARVTVTAQVALDARRFEGAAGVGSVAGLLVLAVEERDGRRHLVRDRVTAFLTGEHPDLVVGTRLRLSGRLQPADRSRDSAVLRVDDRTDVLATPWWWAASERVRAGVRDSVRHAAPAPAALVPALVAGDDAALPAQVEEEFRRTGLTHLLAVSGTNLTIVLAMLLAVARALRAPPRVLLVVGLLGVVAFVLLARPEPSVLRAAGMGVVGLAALGLGSRGGLRALAVAVVALLFVDPWLSVAIGFVLSVSATAGILVAAPPLARRFERWMPRWAAVGLAVPLAAQAACTPAIAAISDQVSLVAVLANVLAAPVVAPATVLGLLAGLVDLVLPALATLLGSAAAACAAWIVLVARWCAAVPGAALTWTQPWWVLLLVVPLVLLAVWRWGARPTVVVGLCLGLGVAMLRPPSPGWPPDGWRVVACDVGQGDATVLRSGPGEAVVVDAGLEPGDVDRCLRELRVRRVRALVLTHADADHVGGRAGVLTGRTVDVVLVGRPGVDVGDVPVRQVAVGDGFSVGEVEADVLWPRPAPSEREPVASDRNGASVVLRARVGNVTVLLTGDVGAAEQDRLAAGGTDVSADVLKVAHHGSADTSARFVERVAPAVATISVGADNGYGHPAPSALAMLDRGGVRVARTDTDGDVAVVVRDDALRVVTRR